MTNVNAIIELNEAFLLGKIEKPEFDKKAKKIENFQYFNNLPDFRKYELEYLNSVRKDAKDKADAIQKKLNDEKNERIAKEKAEKLAISEAEKLAKIAFKVEEEAQKAEKLALLDLEKLESKDFLLENSKKLASKIPLNDIDFNKFKRYCELYGSSVIDKKAFYGTINGINSKVQYTTDGIVYTFITSPTSPKVVHYTEFQILKNGGLLKFIENNPKYPFIESKLDKDTKETFTKIVSNQAEKLVNAITKDKTIELNEVCENNQADKLQVKIANKAIKAVKAEKYTELNANFPSYVAFLANSKK